MDRVFVESRSFTRRVESLGGQKLLLLVQCAILADPKAGNAVPGLGGVRKLRLGDEAGRRGKRGAYRVLYLDLSAEALTYLLVLIDKADAEDISPDEKKIIRRLVTTIKSEVRK